MLPASLAGVYVLMNFSVLEYYSLVGVAVIIQVDYSNLNAKLMMSFHGFST
jgi:hypothetical protein